MTYKQFLIWLFTIKNYEYVNMPKLANLKKAIDDLVYILRIKKGELTQSNYSEKAKETINKYCQAVIKELEFLIKDDFIVEGRSFKDIKRFMLTNNQDSEQNLIDELKKNQELDENRLEKIFEEAKILEAKILKLKDQIQKANELKKTQLTEVLEATNKALEKKKKILQSQSNYDPTNKVLEKHQSNYDLTQKDPVQIPEPNKISAVPPTHHKTEKRENILVLNNSSLPQNNFNINKFTYENTPINDKPTYNSKLSIVFKGLGLFGLTGLGAILGTALFPGLGTGIGMAIGATVAGSIGLTGLGLHETINNDNEKSGLALASLGTAGAGALIGGILGSIFFPVPVVGTAIGAGIGAAVGAAIPAIFSFIGWGFEKIFDAILPSKPSKEDQSQPPTTSQKHITSQVDSPDQIPNELYSGTLAPPKEKARSTQEDDQSLPFKKAARIPITRIPSKNIDPVDDVFYHSPESHSSGS